MIGGLLAIEAMLMTFSICAAMLGQPSLAVMGSTAFITLAGEIVHRLLSQETRRRKRTSPPARNGERHRRRPVTAAGKRQVDQVRGRIREQSGTAR